MSRKKLSPVVVELRIRDRKLRRLFNKFQKTGIDFDRACRRTENARLALKIARQNLAEAVREQSEYLRKFQAI